MKISIYNFKSIGSLVKYEMRPLTILSGTNSSGKSSFIQFLLILKQTLEDNSRDRVLKLNGQLYPVRNYLDILKNKNSENKLKIEFVFNKSELAKYKDFDGFSIYNSLDNYDLQISITFDISDDDKVFVSDFEVKFESEGEAPTSLTKFINRDNSFYAVNTSLGLLINDNLIPRNIDYAVKRIYYNAFIPGEIDIEVIGDSIEFPKGMADPTVDLYKEVPKLDGIKSVLEDFFTNLNYVGPFRIAPEDYYPVNRKSNSVGSKGENVAESLCELSEEQITFSKIVKTEDEINFVKAEDTLINAVKYWLCERFKLCSDIYSKKVADSYIIEVISLSGVISTIKHVGFGISQILPIIVEGLRISNEETFVLEQPEVHLHPKVQSGLTDFLISLVEVGKKVIVETHSDHIITRLRRRIAEDQSNKLDDNVLLTFVEVGKNDVIFRNITINDYGIIEMPYPDGFIENPDSELTAVLKAQMKKRLKAREK